MTAAPVTPVEPAVIVDTRDEKEIERSLINTWQSIGFEVWKLSQPRATMQAEGIADLFVTGHGVTVWCEAKTATGEQSEKQAIFETHVTANGGHYLLARNEGDVIAFAESLGVLQ